MKGILKPTFNRSDVVWREVIESFEKFVFEGPVANGKMVLSSGDFRERSNPGGNYSEKKGGRKMTLEVVRDALGWCGLMNLGLLLWWWGLFIFAHDWIARMHGRWFKISVETFDAFHYGGMLLYKVGIFLLIIVPYLALRIVG